MMEKIGGGTLESIKVILAIAFSIGLLLSIIWVIVGVRRFMKTGSSGRGFMDDFIKLTPIGHLRMAEKGADKIKQEYKKHRRRVKARGNERRADRAKCSNLRGFKKFRCESKANLKKRR